MERIVLFSVTDPETNMDRIITFNPNKEVYEFWHKFEKNGLPIMASNVFSTAGINEIVRCFKKTHYGGPLLPEKSSLRLTGALERFAEFSAWEDEQKLNAAIKPFKIIEEEFKNSKVLSTV